MEIHNLTVGYKKNVILDQAGLTVESHKIIGLVAPNGTGKTTFLKAIPNLISPKKGTISLNDSTIDKNRSFFLSQLMFLEDNEFLYSDISVLRHLKYVKEIWKSKVEINEVVDRLNMRSYLNKSIKKLSLGMKQHVLIAMCIISDADLILLDEPMNGLDPTSQIEVSELLRDLRNSGKTIILSSHHLPNVSEICDSFLFMKNQNLILTENTEESDLQKLYEEHYIKSGGGKNESI